MRVFRGRAATIDADRQVGDRLFDVAATGERALRVWVPHRQVAFGRRDAISDGYHEARAAARERGFPPVERTVGGRAVAYDGSTALAFARVEPVSRSRYDIARRYDRALDAVQRALSTLGVDTVRGEPPSSFCPGEHSLRLASGDTLGGKVAGVAQRVKRDAASVSGVVVVDHADELATVLGPVYEALGVPFDPTSIESVAAGGGPATPEPVRDALERALGGDDAMVVEVVSDVE